MALLYPEGHLRSVAIAAASDHDDRYGRLPGAAAGRAVARHRLGHAEAVRHCDCGGAALAACARLLCESGALPDGRQRRRRVAGVTQKNAGQLWLKLASRN